MQYKFIFTLNYSYPCTMPAGQVSCTATQSVHQLSFGLDVRRIVVRYSPEAGVQAGSASLLLDAYRRFLRQG